MTGSGEVTEEKKFPRLEALCKLYRRCRKSSGEKRESESSSQDRALLGLFWLGIPAVLAMFVYAAYEGGLAMAMLAAAASFAVGALFGFLFGIPRANTTQHVAAPTEGDSGSGSAGASARCTCRTRTWSRSQTG